MYNYIDSKNLNLMKVCDDLGTVKHKWKCIGVQLGIPHHKIKEFETEHEPFMASIDYWLRGNVEDVPVTWQSIVAALKSTLVGEPGLAKRISKKYQVGEGE